MKKFVTVCMLRFLTMTRMMNALPMIVITEMEPYRMDRRVIRPGDTSNNESVEFWSGVVWKSSPLDANVEESSNRTKSPTEPPSRVDDAATTDDGSVKRNSPGVEEFVRRNSDVMFQRNSNGILFEFGPFTGKCPFTISI